MTATLTARRRHLHVTALVMFQILSVLVSLAAGIIISHSLHTWYGSTTRPRFTPPAWLFTPVWTVLYLGMAAAAWLVWRKTRRSRRDPVGNLGRLEARKDAMALYGIQLTLSLTWVFAFFHLHRLLVAVGVILLLWLAVASTMFLFWRIRRLAALLLLPYLGWISFCIALNLFFLRLN